MAETDVEGVDHLSEAGLVRDPRRVIEAVRCGRPAIIEAERHAQSLPAEPRHVYSIGHSSHSLERLIELLRQHRIEVVADVRSAPWSKFAPWFGKSVLAEELPRAGIRYVFMGDQLGGKPEDDAYEGLVESTSREKRTELYRRLAAAPFFQAGLARLEQGAARYRVAILCSEENPAVCHRHHLISPALMKRGVIVHHIRGDGSLELAQVPAAVEPDETPKQLALL